MHRSAFHWNLALLAALTAWGPSPARAQEQCENCKAQGNGGGQGGGEEAAQILMGIAAIITAMSPMVTAAIAAGADKSIARTNARAQITMTQITADTSKFLSDQQKQVALRQTAAAERINRFNQDQVSERLQVQLAELRDARQDAQMRELIRRQEERRLNDERIELARKQADDNLRLARLTLNVQLTQAGLVSGFQPSGVAVSRPFLPAAPGRDSQGGVASQRAGAAGGDVRVPSAARPLLVTHSDEGRALGPAPSGLTISRPSPAAPRGEGQLVLSAPSRLLASLAPPPGRPLAGAPKPRYPVSGDGDVGLADLARFIASSGRRVPARSAPPPQRPNSWRARGEGRAVASAELQALLKKHRLQRGSVAADVPRPQEPKAEEPLWEVARTPVPPEPPRPSHHSVGR